MRSLAQLIIKFSGFVGAAKLLRSISADIIDARLPTDSTEGRLYMFVSFSKLEPEDSFAANTLSQRRPGDRAPKAETMEVRAAAAWARI